MLLVTPGNFPFNLKYKAIAEIHGKGYFLRI